MTQKHDHQTADTHFFSLKALQNDEFKAFVAGPDSGIEDTALRELQMDFENSLDEKIIWSADNLFDCGKSLADSHPAMLAKGNLARAGFEIRSKIPSARTGSGLALPTASSSNSRATPRWCFPAWKSGGSGGRGAWGTSFACCYSRWQGQQRPAATATTMISTTTRSRPPKLHGDKANCLTAKNAESAEKDKRG
jgi:hypothetical protein